MKKAYRLFWWKKKECKGNDEDLEIIIITDSIDKVIDLFKRDFPEHNTAHITNIEVMSATVVVE